MIVGLTGGIGSGKTTVAKLFEVMGCAIYNSDDRAKELYFNASVKKDVINLLGKEVYKSDTEIDRDYISKKVFADTTLLHQLNNIIHPAVKSDFEEFVKQFPSDKIIVKETALLFETGIYKTIDYSILVTAPTQLKIERVMKRNGSKKEEIEKRINAQWSDEQKTSLANFVIENDNTKALIPQVLEVIKILKHHA